MNIYTTSQEYPSVSVIIPVRNEEKYITECVRNVMDTTYPRDKIEIIVIDGESTDRTCEQVHSLQAEGNHVILLANTKRTPYAGLNVGLRSAKGDVILRVDARSLCPRDYVRRCVDTLLTTGADNVGGVQKPIGDSPRQRAIALAMTQPFGVGNAQFRLGRKSGYVDTVYLGCFKREVFDRLGLYDENGPVIGEDSEMNQRIIRNGGRVYLNKDIVVSYIAKGTLRDFWRQYFVYGGARAHSFLRSKRFTSLRQLVPLIFLLSLIILPFLSFLHRALMVLWFLIVGAYLSLDLIVATKLSIRHTDHRLFLWLLLAFPCMHFAWAFGFFVRLLEGSHPGRHWRR